jgi:cytochrome c peroxidase
VSGVRGESTFSALPQSVVSPPDNPSTPDKVALGRLLFWDPVLSGGEDVACATCHHPSTGYTDHRDVPIGAHGVGLGPDRRFPPGNQIPFVRRNSPTVLNAAFNGIDSTGHYDPAAAPMFWDSRVAGLEAQAAEPMRAFEEMRGDGYTKDEIFSVVAERLTAIPEYAQTFTRVFGGPDAVNPGNISKAIASFERSLVAANSPFDRYMRGDHSAMTSAQVDGMAQFERSGCVNCHKGPMFSDYKTHVIGVPDNVRSISPDTGVDGSHAFRTPSLRNLAFTAPYTHSGVIPSLDGMLNFYNLVSRGPGPDGGRPGGRGPRGQGFGPQGFGFGRPGRPGGPGGRGAGINVDVRRDQLDPLLRQVDVRQGRAELLAFLGALNDDGFDRSEPDRVPSGLPPGGNIRPPR